MGQSFLGELLIKITGDSAELDQSINKSEKSIQKFSTNAKSLGDNLTKFVTLPLVGLGTLAVKSFAESVDAEAKFNAALMATGKQSEINVNNFKALTAELQKTTVFEDDAQLAALGLVQSLANLNESGLKALLPRMLDFSAAMGVDLQTAASLFGKTLGSTTNALGRYGIQIGDDLKGEDRLLALTTALDSKFKDYATTTAKLGTGPMKQLLNTLGDVAENFGEVMLPVINDLIPPIKDAITAFGNLDSGTKKLIVTGGALLAAIGPIVGIIGSIATPVGAAVAAFAALGAVIGLVVKSVNDSNNQFITSANAAKNETQEINDLVKQYDDLKSKTSLNVTEKEKLFDVETRLRTLLPETAFEFDKQSNVIGINTQKLKEHLAELQKVEKINLQDQLQRLKDEQERIETDLKNSQNRLKNTLKEYSGQSAADKALGESTAEYEARKRNAAKPIEDEITNYRKKSIDLINQQADVQQRLNEINGVSTQQQQNQLKQQKAQIDSTNTVTGLQDFLLSRQQTEVDIISKTIDAKGMLLNVNDVLGTQTIDILENVAAESKAFEDLKNTITSTIGYVSQGFQILSGLSSTLSNNRMTEMNDEYNRQKENIENTITDEKEKKAALEALDKDYEEKKRAEKKKSAEAEKAWNITNSIISTAAAVAKALPDIPLSILAGVIGAAQTAIIAAQAIPEFAAGGFVPSTPGGMLARVAEAGTGEFMIPDRQDFMSRLANKITSNMQQPINNTFSPNINNSINGPMVLSIDGQQFKAYINQQSARGNIIINKNRGISRR